jgi:DNA-binding protein YbaB
MRKMQKKTVRVLKQFATAHVESQSGQLVNAMSVGRDS